ncbi:HigA family addiction module antitoxin [Sediminibacterium soli]|uniref:HigA family addiction module antitoxin n=1 Tax=Sediminibacterium soli TaxID=2698829 RepID=UPI00137AAD94|nr:HigA family addiction module antitoxin [Sediminibacterium soli]NCI46149.1 HigA family addiction module antidote protein [Sediminibacterium soli]
MSDYKIIGKNGKEIFTDISLHPGEVLADELTARNISKQDFACQLDMRPSHFSDLLHGRRHVGAALALKLEKLLKISAEYWMRLQVYYDLVEERNRQENAA